MVFVTRKEHFNAAHQLRNPAWSDEQNVAVFGKCANQNWHGHNYDLYVTVKGHPHPDTGFVIDLLKLRNLIRKEVIEELDHRNINLDVPFMLGKMASTENLAVAIWVQLANHISKEGVLLHSIKLYETERNFVEYFGPETSTLTTE